MAEIGRDVSFAANLLNKDEVVGIPTETVYGLAGNATSPDAILKIYQVKNRPQFDPLISHSSGLEKVRSWVPDMPEKAVQLAEHFWPGPLTLLIPRGKNFPDILTSGLPLMAFRVPEHEVARQLLQKLDYPLAAPSANPFGYVSPVTAAHVQDQLGDKIPYILDGGPSQVGLESTIVGFENDLPTIHRLGGLSVEDIEAVVGEVTLDLHKSSNPKAPGMLKSHYSPGKPLIVGDLMYQYSKANAEKVGIISFKKRHSLGVQEYVLSPRGDLGEAARNLFTALRALAEADVDLIIAEKFPEIGLGRAINDRLQRAAAN